MIRERRELPYEVHQCLLQLNLNADFEVRLSSGIRMDLYFEEPATVGVVRWAVDCVESPNIGRNIINRLNELWGKCEPSIRSGELDRVLFVTYEPLPPRTAELFARYPALLPVTIDDLRSRVAERQNEILDNQKDGFPAADRFVRIDHNSLAVREASEALDDLARQVEQSNTLPLAKDERAAIAAEIRILVGMLQERVVRLAQVQFAISEVGVLGYLKGSFSDHIAAGAVGAAITMLLKALGLPI
jgi:hypothetical protein